MKPMRFTAVATLFSIYLVFGLVACKDEDLEATVPAYITINDISVNPSKSEYGSGSDNIKDAWVYNGNELLGVFELPATIPIQKTGQVRLSVAGGIFNNALSNDRQIYPFYTFYTIDTLLRPRDEITLNPVLDYQDNGVYDLPWSGEDFESGINFEYNSRSDTVFIRETGSLKFEGQASGLAYLDESMDFFEAYTPTFSNIPKDGRPVYLELDYFCTHDFAISIYTNDKAQQYSVVNFKPTGSWNKVYVEFGPVFSTLFNSFNYNIAIGFVKPIGEKGTLYVDNIKLAHY